MNRKDLSAIGLVAGTCIGAVTVALPVSMAQIGFLGCGILFIICWFAMVFTGILVLKVNHTLGKHASFMSMANHTLGARWSWLVVLSYGGLLYALLSAYLTGGGDILATISPKLFTKPLYASTAFFVLGCLILYSGRDFLGKINHWLLVFLVVVFCVMLLIVLPSMHASNLVLVRLDKVGSSWLVMLAAFGYQVIVPSLRQHCGGDYSKASRAIWLGSAVPLLIYLLWTMAVMGRLPLVGVHSLLSLQSVIHPAGMLPVWMASGPNVVYMQYSIELFIFFAIATSFFGISISLYDFVKDSLLNIVGEFNQILHIISVVIVLLPPAMYSYFWPGGFIAVLNYAGGFVLFLNVILPIWMYKKIDSK